MKGVAKALRSLGPLAGDGSWNSLFSAVVRSLFRNETVAVYVKELCATALADPGGRGQGGARRGLRHDLDELRRAEGRELWEFNRDRFDGVNEFFVCDAGEGVGHISWLYDRFAPNRILCLGDGEVEIKYSYTLDSMRGRGLYPRTLRAIQEHLARSGYARVFICAHAGNSASKRGIEKAGFRYVTQRRLVKVLGIQLTKRYCHLKENPRDACGA